MIARVLPDQAAGRLLDYRVPECFGDSVGVGVAESVMIEFLEVGVREENPRLLPSN